MFHIVLFLLFFSFNILKLEGVIYIKKKSEQSQIRLEYLYDPSFYSIRGILVLLHGCSHSATDFFKKEDVEDNACSNCLNLPAEKNIIKIAKDKNLLPLAISSMNSKNKCWNHYDLDFINEAVNDVIKRTKMDIKNVYVFGASSGASMAFHLSTHSHLLKFKLSGIICQIAIPQEQQFALLKEHKSKIPTVIMTMSRDHAQVRLIPSISKHYKDNGIPFHHFLVEPKQMTVEYFVKYGINKVLSEDIVTALLTNRIISKSGSQEEKMLLRHDPRSSDWRRYIQPVLSSSSGSSGSSTDSLKADASPISEIMNIAYAFHEMTDEYVADAIEFLDTHQSSI